MKQDYNFNYVFVMYDIADIESEVGKYRVSKVFKICKKYLKPYQKSIFRGEITPAKLLRLRSELEEVIDEELDFISIIKLANQNSFLEEHLGKDTTKHNSLFL